jgi:hypothetical protein
MKSFPSKIIKIINFLLNPLKAKLVSSSIENFNMDAAIERIRNHNIPINTVIDIGGSDGAWSHKAIKFLPHSFFIAIEPLIEREKALCNLRQMYPNFDFKLCAA